MRHNYRELKSHLAVSPSSHMSNLGTDTAGTTMTPHASSPQEPRRSKRRRQRQNFLLPLLAILTSEGSVRDASASVSGTSASRWSRHNFAVDAFVGSGVRAQGGYGRPRLRETLQTQEIRRRRVRRRAAYAMDVDGPEGVSAVPAKQVVAREGNIGGPASIVSEGCVTVEGRNAHVQVPLEVAQVGGWLPVPLVENPLPPSLSSTRIAINKNDDKNKTNTNGEVKTKADPFAVPDNDYNDSFLDLLWINLFASRMSAAVEKESFSTAAGVRTRRQRGTPKVLMQSEEWPAAAAAAASAIAVRPKSAGEGIAEDHKGNRSNDDLRTEGKSTINNGNVKSSSDIPAKARNGFVDTVGSSSVDVKDAAKRCLEEAGAQLAVEASVRNGNEKPLSLATQNGFDTQDLQNGETPQALQCDARRTGEVGLEFVNSKIKRGVSDQSKKSGGMDGWYTYEDYVNLATKLQAGPPERQRQVVRGVLRSIFPTWFPAFYRTLFPPSKFSAQVNAFMCPPLFAWLVGKSELTEGIIDLQAVADKPARQEVWRSTVKVERCRYLEASKCKGTCMNLCKLPTEAFFREDLGMHLRMTPNFEDLSCEFAFGQAAASVEDDPLMQEPCWTECLNSDKQPKTKPQRACHTMPESPLKGV